MSDTWDSPDGQTHHMDDDCAPSHRKVEKTSAWTEEERNAPAPSPVAPAVVDAAQPPPPPSPPPWVAAFEPNTLIQHHGWWARIKGYGQDQDGDICVIIAPLHKTGRAMRGSFE